MSQNFSKIGVVILAAGDGKRMKTGIPKVLNLLKGKPLVQYVVESAVATGFGSKPIVVVSANHNQVQDTLGESAAYAIQDKQLGTGHAVRSAEALWSSFDHVVVLYGDMPFVSAASLQKLVSEHQAAGNSMTFMTTTVPDFSGTNAYFSDFGRIVRDASGALVKNVQKKDATPEELHITELDTSYMCFEKHWLQKHLADLQPTNAQQEYYLTDLLMLALREGVKVGTVSVPPAEAFGVNTKEHLDIASSL